MDTRATRCTPDRSDPLILAAATWLACGMVLYGFSPLPLHDATLGWSAAFWLLAAPALVLLLRWLAAGFGRRGHRRDTAAGRWRSGFQRHHRRPAIRRRSASAPQGTPGIRGPYRAAPHSATRDPLAHGAARGHRTLAS